MSEVSAFFTVYTYDALKNELYFLENLHKKGLKIFDLVEKAKLPDIEGEDEKEKQA